MTVQDKARELLSSLKNEMNGAVTQSMQDKGISYGLNYGVSLPTLKKIASVYQYDNQLAEYLYAMDIREAKLASLYIADPLMLTDDKLSFWLEGITTTEVAEIISMTLFYSSRKIGTLLERLFASGNPLLNYAGLLSMVRTLRGGSYVPEEKYVLALAARFLTGDNPFVIRAMCTLLREYMDMIPGSTDVIKEYLNSPDCPVNYSGTLAAELGLDQQLI